MFACVPGKSMVPDEKYGRVRLGEGERLSCEVVGLGCDVFATPYLPVAQHYGNLQSLTAPTASMSINK